MTELFVGIRNIATDAKPAFSDVMLTYQDFQELEQNFCVVLPDWDRKVIKGIFDVEMSKVAMTSTSIKVGLTLECSGSDVDNLVAANFIVRDASGAVQTVSFVPFDTVNKCYEFTGTGFVTGYTVELNGVITIASTATSYELVETLVL